MARKTEDLTIEAGGRDQGKVFRLTEMPAAQAEKWAMRVFLALAKSGVEIPENIEDGGMSALMTVGVKSLSAIPFELAEPLLDEMMNCVQFVPDPRKKMVARRLMDDDIEEVKTRLLLRKAIITLHTGFFSNASP